MSVGFFLLEIIHWLPPFITLTDLLLLLVYHTEQVLTCAPLARAVGRQAGGYRLSTGVGIVGHTGSSAKVLYTLCRRGDSRAVLNN